LFIKSNLVFYIKLEELEILTGIKYLCVEIDANKTKGQITVFNSEELVGTEKYVGPVSQIFLEKNDKTKR
jgi:hypothetical protein